MPKRANSIALEEWRAWSRFWLRWELPEDVSDAILRRHLEDLLEKLGSQIENLEARSLFGITIRNSADSLHRLEIRVEDPSMAELIAGRALRLFEEHPGWSLQIKSFCESGSYLQKPDFLLIFQFNPDEAENTDAMDFADHFREALFGLMKGSKEN